MPPQSSQTNPNNNGMVVTNPVATNSSISSVSPVHTTTNSAQGLNSSTSTTSFGTAGRIAGQNNKSGTSAVRPEIISVMDFVPIYNGANSTNSNDFELTNHGKLLDIKIKSIALRRDNLVQLINSIVNSGVDQDNKTKQVIDEFNKEIQVINSFLSLAKDYLLSIDSIKDSFDLGKLFLNTNFSYGFSYYGQNQSFTKNVTIEQFLNQYSQISKDKIQAYSNTKLFQQLVVDTRSMLEKHSFGLLSDQDPDRVDDYNPISIDTSYSLRNNFSLLSLNPQGSFSGNAANYQGFNAFYSLLSNTSKQDRVKLLITLISKEYRISKGLGNGAIVNKMKNSFNVNSDTGSPFGTIFGIPSDDIFKLPSGGDSSLASLAIMSAGGTTSQFILPFEQKLIKDSNTGIGVNNAQQNITSDSQYIPGSTYFVDSIFDNISVQTDSIIFNTQPIESYMNNLITKINDMSTIVRDLLQADNMFSNLWPLKMYMRYLNGIQLSTNKLVYQFKANKQQAIVAAIFRLANKDNELKKMLFEFLLIYGIIKESLNGTNRIFSVLGRELKNYTSFSILNSILGPNQSPVLEFTDPQYFGPNASTFIPYAQALVNRIDYQIRNKDKASRDQNVQNAINYSEINKSSSQDDLEVFDNINYVDISSALMGDLTPGASVSTGENLIKQWMEIVDLFYDEAAGTYTIEHIIPDGSGRTRLSSMTTSMQLLCMFETMLSLTDLYVKADFVKYNDSYNITSTLILYNPKVQNIINTYLMDLVSKNANSTTPQVQTEISITKFSQPQFASEVDYAQLQNSSFIMNGPNGPNVFGQTDQALNQLRTSNISSTISFNKKSSAYQDFINSLLVGSHSTTNDIATCIAGEMKAIDGYLQIFDKIKGSLQNSLITLKTKFDSNTNGLLRAYAIYSNNDFRILKEKTQIQNSLYLYDQTNVLLKEALPVQATRLSDAYRPLFVGAPESGNNSPSETEIAMIKKLFSQEQFIGNAGNINKKTKIVSVGIPAGFSKTFSSSVAKGRITSASSLRTNTDNSDIIKVNIYKRNHNYGELVYKPISFLFDLSMFQETIDFNDIVDLDSATFAKCVQNNYLLDYESLSLTSANRKFKIDTIQNSNPKYYSVNDEQKIEIWKNHLTSYLISKYTNYMLNLSINEFMYYDTSSMRQGTFFDSVTNVNQTELGIAGTIDQNKYRDFRDIVFKYIQQQLNVTLDKTKTNKEIINDSAVPKNAKDVLRLMTNGSMVSDPGNLYNSLLAPKTFERIFFIPFDADSDFELDMTKTNSTPIGRATWNSDEFQQNKLVVKDGKYYLVPSKPDDTIINSFFVTLEEGL